MGASVTIAIDGMGGDKAPDIVVDGLRIARTRLPEVDFLVFGDQARIGPLLAARPIESKSGAVVRVIHTDEVVTGADKPSQVLRQGRRSSMWLAVEAVQRGEAGGIVSAGNTGALMAVSKFLLRMLPGIDRPAIASFLPTARAEAVMLDLGANIECAANNLVDFALMGDVFARMVLGIERPTVGLLNVGSEDMKGSDEVRAAATILREGRVPVRFHGFVEGDDIARGTVDVVVTDGFTGNIALKAMEGTARLYSSFLKEAFASSLSAKLGYLLARGALHKLRLRFDPRRYNGAMFLGLNGVAVKSHGGTDALGFANAIEVAADLIAQGFNERIKFELSRLHPDGDEQARAAAL